MSIELYKNDLSDEALKELTGCDIAIDTEAMGLNNHRDRLCVVQISKGDGKAHLVKFDPRQYEAPKLKQLLGDNKTQKIMHFARFDVAIIYQYLDVLLEPIYCTKIASKFARTYTDSHGLKDLCRELLGISISKQQQSSYWGDAALTQEQINYAASDVLYLHQLRDKLNQILIREGRTEYAEAAFRFLPARAIYDIIGFDSDIFAY